MTREAHICRTKLEKSCILLVFSVQVGQTPSQLLLAVFYALGLCQTEQ